MKTLSETLRGTKFYKKLTPYLACAYAEGFGEGEACTTDEELSAWQYLVDTGLCWNLQGYYGRTAVRYLQEGIILPAQKDHKDYYGNTIPANTIPR